MATEKNGTYYFDPETMRANAKFVSGVQMTRGEMSRVKNALAIERENDKRGVRTAGRLSPDPRVKLVSDAPRPNVERWEFDRAGNPVPVFKGQPASGNTQSYDPMKPRSAAEAAGLEFFRKTGRDQFGNPLGVGRGSDARNAIPPVAQAPQQNSSAPVPGGFSYTPSSSQKAIIPGQVVQSDRIQATEPVNKSAQSSAPSAMVYGSQAGRKIPPSGFAGYQAHDGSFVTIGPDGEKRTHGSMDEAIAFTSALTQLNNAGAVKGATGQIPGIGILQSTPMAPQIARPLIFEGQKASKTQELAKVNQIQKQTTDTEPSEGIIGSSLRIAASLPGMISKGSQAAAGIAKNMAKYGMRAMYGDKGMQYLSDPNSNLSRSFGAMETVPYENTSLRQQQAQSVQNRDNAMTSKFTAPNTKAQMRLSEDDRWALNRIKPIFSRYNPFSK